MGCGDVLSEPIVGLLPRPALSKPARLAALAILHGIMAEGLLYGQQIGIGVTIFVLALLSAMVWIIVGERRGDLVAICWRSVGDLLAKCHLVDLSR